MCLAVPIRIKKILDGQMAEGDLQGVGIAFSTQLLESPVPGQYVMVHAGVAIETLDEEEALKTIRMINEITDHGTD